ncbi:DUF5999 family protein [Streptomyces sp. TRM68367]|uniref:DUF5999 family protein n=1 Tax=Streptomyces sp. TRM68367 TaxID=2758415 RepID=UPI001CA81126
MHPSVPTRPHASAFQETCSRLRSVPLGEVQRRWRLCNGVLLFEDSGKLLPDGQIVAPRRVASAGMGAI